MPDDLPDNLINKAVADWNSAAHGGSIEPFREDLQALEKRNTDNSSKDFVEPTDRLLQLSEKDAAKLDDKLWGQIPNLAILGTYYDDVIVQGLSSGSPDGVLRSDHGLLREGDLVPPQGQGHLYGSGTLKVKQEATPPLYSDPHNPLADIRPDHVVQGAWIGDCKFAAKLTALTQVDPSAIVKMIQDNKDGTFTVTFPGDKDHSITVSAPNTWEQETFADSGSAYWVSVIFKAYRKLINEPMGPLKGQKTIIDSLLTGKKYADLFFDHSLRQCDSKKFDEQEQKEKDTESCHMPLWVENPHKTLTDAEQNHMLVTAGTANLPAGKDAPTAVDRSGNEVLLEKWHDYTVMNYDLANQIVTLRNPWGYNYSVTNPDKAVGDGYITVPLNEFEKYFVVVTMEETTLSKLGD